jgi:hypothetical protein
VPVALASVAIVFDMSARIDTGHFCDSVAVFVTLIRAGGVTQKKTGDRNGKSSQVKSSQKF